MATQNGTILGVTLLSGDPAGSTSTVTGKTYTRKAYLLTCSFPAYTGSTDTATITGVGTAIATSTRNGAAVNLIAVVPALAGLDANAQGVHATGAASPAMTISNATTTGDAAGQLSDASGAELTATSGTTIGVGVIAIVDEN